LLSIAIWTGLVIAVLRTVVVYGMERLSHGSEAAYVHLRIARALPRDVLAGVALGVLVVACLTGARALRRNLVFLLTPLLWIAASGVVLVFLAGWIQDDATRKIGMHTARGRLALAALAPVSLGVAFLALLWLLRSPDRKRGPLLTLGLPIGAALLGPLGWDLLHGSLGDRMVVRNVVLTLFDRPEAWNVRRHHPEARPRAAVLCPSIDYRLDGGDMPALVLPPPGRVEIPLHTPDGGPVGLHLRVAIDRTTMVQHLTDLAGCSVRFRVALPDGTELEQEVPFESVGQSTGSEWKDLTPADGLPVKDGDVIALETELLGPNGYAIPEPPPLLVGFGGLTGERRYRAERTRSAPDRPNLVLIVMDTQRADRMSLYGYPRETTPRLDALAARGSVFEQAHATASWTWPSTASILSGLQPMEHGVTSPASCYLADSVETLPEVLQRAGFTTAAWSANPLIVPDKNFDQGFELFDHGKGGTRKSETIVPAVLEWLDAVAGTRFFLYVHLADPHAPLTPLPEARERFAPEVPLDFDPKAIVEYAWPLLRGEGHTDDGRIATDQLVPREEQRWISDLYDACVWSGDHWVGRILDRLASLGLSDETIVAFTSDHGEEIFDHGLATHGQSLYGELMRIPLVLAGPGVPVGRRVAVPVSNLHVAPTLAALVGLQLAGPEHPIDLTSLAGDASDATGGEVLFSTMQGWWNGRFRQPLYGMRAGDLVLHFAPQGSDWGEQEPAEGGRWALYDLADDAREKHDLSAERAQRAAAMKDELMQRIDELEERRLTPRIEAGSATLQMLRDLGYIGRE